MIDLTVVSVLLDAGAGAAWTYREGEREFVRSEGDPALPWRLDPFGGRGGRSPDLGAL